MPVKRAASVGISGVSNRGGTGVKGYEVVTSEGRKMGRVSEDLDGFVVVEIGRVLRSRRPVPKEFAHAQDGDRTVVVTVPKDVVTDAPRVHRHGTFDVEEASRHYGLASSYTTNESLWAEGSPEEAESASLTKQPEDEIERRPERVYMPGGK
jgi:hypothetical protein